MRRSLRRNSPTQKPPRGTRVALFQPALNYFFPEEIKMRKLVLGMGATALLATVAFASDQTSTTTQTEQTKVAALDTSSSAFAKLDADHDGRVSAIEAANNSSLAAAFTQGDSDKDGYLSRDEFQSLGSTSTQESSKSSSSTQSTTTPSDAATAPPQQ
jgi:hypothetical protein